MTDLVTTGGAPVTIAPAQGRIVTGGPVHARVLVTHDHPSYASTFEVTIAPRFDVGAHAHTNGEEMFYVIDGHIDVLCFEPVDRSTGDWHQWASPTGQTFLRSDPGAFMYVPPGTPHAFANPTDQPARMFFQSSVAGGHENYFAELGELLAAAHGHPDPAAIRDLEARYGTEQLTAMHPGNGSGRLEV